MPYNNNERNIGRNSIIYMIKTLAGLILPLITFPYVMRTLSIESMGAVNFASSIISYFSLLAMLGINTFAIRSGAKYRKSRGRFESFASEVFTINSIATALSYILFCVLFILNVKWHGYTQLLFIFSITIPLNTIGVEWIYSIYEDYLYITVRSLVFQFASVVYLFLAVRSEDDIIQYAVYCVLATAGSNIINFVKARKYVTLKFVLTKRMKSYIKPILVLFASSVAATIYLNSDITILGYLSGDKEVGYYNAAVKMYTIAKTILTAIVTVSMPTLSYLVGSRKTADYQNTFDNLLKVIAFICVPSSLGLFTVSYKLIVLFSGSGYYVAGLYLKILSIALIPSSIGSFLASGCLVLFGKENKILFASIVGAVVNIILNLAYIPVAGTMVAACTTLIAEILTTIIHIYNSRELVNYRMSMKSIFETICASSIMLVVCSVVCNMINGIVLSLAVTIFLGIMLYTALSLFMKNDAIVILLKLKNK